SQSRKSIETDKDPLYKLIKAEINDFKSYILNTMMSKDAALQVEESRLQQEIQQCRLNLVRATIETPGVEIEEEIPPDLEERILHTKSKLEDLESRAAVIKLDIQQEIRSLHGRISDLLTEFLSAKEKIGSMRDKSKDEHSDNKRKPR